MTGGPNGAVQRWEVATGRALGETITHYTTVFAVTFSPDGRLLLTGGNDNAAQVVGLRHRNHRIGRPDGT